MNIEQFTERLCATYRLPRNKGNDYLHINVTPDPEPFVLSRPVLRDNPDGKKTKGHQVNVSVSHGYFSWDEGYAFPVIREWFPYLVTHIVHKSYLIYKVTYLKQGRGYQLHLASTYVFYDGMRIVSNDSLDSLKTKSLVKAKVDSKYFSIANVDTILEDFGDYLITVKTATSCGWCAGGIERFIDCFSLWGKPHLTLRELAPMLVEYDCEGWYRVRLLARQAWKQSNKAK